MGRSSTSSCTSATLHHVVVQFPPGPPERQRDGVLQDIWSEETDFLSLHLHLPGQDELSTPRNLLCFFSYYVVGDITLFVDKSCAEERGEEKIGGEPPPGILQ